MAEEPEGEGRSTAGITRWTARCRRNYANEGAREKVRRGTNESESCGGRRWDRDERGEEGGSGVR